ncbi:MAG: Uncharacterized protein conserved in archaea [Phormidesmis priestleyi Ana]|uniref:Uncharacterized protein conserved in archaea n=1 Tax=Phormidesmis priestleyi Ana TaxID=1666911 RepID=A0A0P7YXA9_9CYAN|nr:MAG: Uncharacterized protein conserved in archaea [Phormidesmis priestleyi Ana]
MNASERPHLPLIGWRERLALPDLQVVSVKAKIDTGARSSALHAFDIERFSQNGEDFVRFRVHASQGSHKKTDSIEVKLLDMRSVRNSGGKVELRPVIQTLVQLGDQQWPIELTLTNRNVMGFRMLLGRQAVRDRFLVDSGQSYLQSSGPKRKRKGLKKPKNKQKNENSNFVEKFIALFDPSA